ncbi:hypothetical protein [Methylocucumis oryzae]|uniref:PEP-CTERM protein-sorting domain-containing protein n=1 Tax=Methylocucumis oryzae TaxID=1632867 RepID=A0A0F3IM81_9GAMM|nr:hypothetical protein [Methylocucumis oryzae]KJV07865.1 hypothetical protein VZ94_02110 [Methylocucumis oryzae]
MKILSNLNKKMTTAVMAFAALAVPVVINAAPYNPSVYVYGPVSNGQSFQNGALEDKNDSASDLNLGFSGWVAIGKENVLNTGAIENTTTLLDATDSGGWKSGTWTIASSLWSTYSKIAIVLKDGGTKFDEGSVFWTAWLLKQGDTTGTWAMPDKALSHMSLYGVECTNSVCGGGDNPPPSVPVPAAVWLFGSGLVGLVGTARRKLLHHHS